MVIAGPDHVFDLSSLGSASKKSRRGVTLFLLCGAVAFLLLWSVFVLPLYFESPRSLQVCPPKGGGCTTAPPPDYYTTIDVYTFSTLGLSVVMFLTALYPTIRGTPTSVRVDSLGFAVDFGGRHPKVVRWESPAFCLIYDLRDAAAAHPKEMQNLGSPFSLETNFWSTDLTEPAFNAILRSARGSKCYVQEIRGGAKQYPETLCYRVWPPG